MRSSEVAAVTGNADISETVTDIVKIQYHIRGFTDGEVEESVSTRLRQRPTTGNGNIQFSTAVFPFPVVRILSLSATLNSNSP